MSFKPLPLRSFASQGLLIQNSQMLRSSSCTLFVTAVDVDRAAAAAMVLADFAATTATPMIFAGSEAAGTVSVSMDGVAVAQVLDMAPEDLVLAPVLGLLVLRLNRPCRRRCHSRLGFWPDRPLQCCMRTR